MHQYIRHFRKESGMTQEEVAEKLFLTPHAISQYENGKRQISVPMMESILALFGYELQIVKSKTTQEELKKMVRSLADLAKVYKDAFPDWEIEHTGGSIFVLYKDFPTFNGHPIMVKMTDEITVINQRLKKTKNGAKTIKGEYITSNEYTIDFNNEGLYTEYGWESEVPIIGLNDDLSPKEFPILYEIFSQEVISQLKEEFQNIKEL